MISVSKEVLQHETMERILKLVLELTLASFVG